MICMASKACSIEDKNNLQVIRDWCDSVESKQLVNLKLKKNIDELFVKCYCMRVMILYKLVECCSYFSVKMFFDKN